MAAELWIDDGNPWYLSSDIWVVPGDYPKKNNLVLICREVLLSR